MPGSDEDRLLMRVFEVLCGDALAVSSQTNTPDLLSLAIPIIVMGANQVET